MTQQIVAGVDWAGGKWLAVIFSDGSYTECILKTGFEELWECTPKLDRMLIDVPIGLPDDEKTLVDREELDSRARSVTGRPSSVFPVPSRSACKQAKDDAEYETVAHENQNEIDKGLTKQSYHIAAGIGEVDEFLRANDSVSEVVIESHPEVCFRGLLGRQLQHSKDTAAGVGERLEALDKHVDAPGTVLEAICRDLTGESNGVEVDDAIDALGLAVTAWRSLEEVRYLPAVRNSDSENLPMQMAYWSENALV